MSPISLWLADYQLLAAALLLGVMLAIAALRQPAQRLAVAKSTLAALAALAILCALPGWSLVHLLSDDAPIVEPAPSRTEPTPAFSSTLSTIEPAPDLFHAQPPESPAGAVLHTNSRDEVEPASPISWSTYLITAYAAGSGAVTLWLITGALLAHRVRRQATPAPPELQALLQQLCGNEKRAPQLLISPHITAPVALGLRRPTILLPATFGEVPYDVAAPSPWRGGMGRGANPIEGKPFDSTDTPPPTPPHQGEGRKQDNSVALLTILAHELAHLQHRDLHTLAATRLLLILLWQQPLYWLLRRTIRLDQETLADAAAADRAGRLDYAQQLLAWASSARTQRPPRLAGAVGLWEGPSQLKRRIAVLLNEKFSVMRSCSRRWRSGSLAAIALMAMGLSTVTFQPQAGVANEADEETVNVESAAAETAEPSAETTVAAANQPGAAADQDPMVAHLGHRSTDNKTPNVIRGRCLDEANQPIADVEVELYRGKRPNGLQRLVTKTKTNVAGEFEFSDVVDPKQAFPDGVIPPNSAPNTEMFMVIARQPGRASREVLADTPYTYREGRSVDVLMPPAARLTGTIKDEAGKPVVGARVSKITMSDFPHVFSAMTDADGRFSINDLAPFDLETEKKWQEEQKKATDAQLAAGADAVLTFSMAPAFTVVHPNFSSKRLPLSSIPGDVDVSLSPGARLRGRVIFADGSPAANATVQIKPSIPKRGNGDWGMIDYGKFNIERDYQVTVQTDAEGRFEAGGLTPGKVDVWAELPGWLNAGIGEFEVKAGPAASLPDLTLTKGGVIRLQLIDDETGRPIPVDEPLVAKVSVIMKNKLGRQETGPDRKKVSEQGTVEIASLPGTAQVMRLSVEAGAEQRWIPVSQFWTEYPQAQVIEGQTVDAEFRVRKAPTANKELKAEPNSADSKNSTNQGAAANRTESFTISGCCLDEAGNPVPNARLWLPLRPEFLDYAATLETVADDAGKFAFQIPAELRGPSAALQLSTIYAYEPGHAVGIASAYKQLKLGDLSAVEVQLPNSATTTYRILDPGGDPVADARVEPWHIPAGGIYPIALQRLLEVTSDALGIVKLRGIRESDIRSVRVHHLVWGAQEFSELNNRRLPSNNDLRLKLVGGIVGRVQTDGGETVAGIPVYASTETEFSQFRGEPTGYATTVTNADGHFEMPVVAAGSGKLNFYVDRDQPWRVRPGGRFTVRIDETVELNVSLERAVRAKGIVRTADTRAPVPHAQVHLRHGDLTGQLMTTEQTVTDEKGRFEAFVLPGEVRMFIQHKPAEFDEWECTEERRKTPVVAPNGIETFDLPPIELERTKAVEGLIVDHNDQPLPKVRLYVTEPNSTYGNYIYGNTTSDEAGRFVMRLPPSVTVEHYVVRTNDWRDRHVLEVVSESPLKLRTPAPSFQQGADASREVSESDESTN